MDTRWTRSIAWSLLIKWIQKFASLHNVKSKRRRRHTLLSFRRRHHLPMLAAVSRLWAGSLLQVIVQQRVLVLVWCGVGRCLLPLGLAA
eukprot:scaffold281319_cov31-Tisochrysis_lutea.AAC.1